jgi:uncharacterized protein (TIGR02996 family)
MARKKSDAPADPWDVQKIEAKAPDAKSITEARKVLAKGGFGKVEPRADGQGWWVVCKGMTDTYEVSVKRGPRGGLESRCTCWSTKKPCKHALALLLYLAEHPEARPEAEAPAAKATVDLESLLRAAFAAPEDDTARLVLADYLEENDQPDRAALIRVQCELARLPAKDAKRTELAQQEAKLLTAVHKQIGKIPVGYKGDFVRGFLRLAVSYSKIKKADGLPAQFVQLFRDGWVEALDFPRATVEPGLTPLFRLVGELDLREAFMNSNAVVHLAEGLKPQDPETRTRIVRLPSAYEDMSQVFNPAEASE